MSTKQKQADKPERLSIWSKLYRGETDIQFVPNRKRWYLVSAVVILGCVVVMLTKGFVLGIDFAGGNQYNVPSTSGTSLTEVEDAAEGVGAEIASAQVAGTGDGASYIVRIAEVDDEQSQDIREAMAEAAGVDPQEISVSTVSGTWGAAVSNQALIALGVFLVLVSAFIWIRYERRMAIASIGALLHDLVLTAGIYALSGFEVTPSTIVGILTILGYSLYDTVVVFDKVQENTANLLQTRQKTFAEAVNDAVNQTLMRSINTTIIGVLPVAALLVVGVGMLGVGTLKDLALVLFIGMVVGTYSSIFLAAPWVVDMAERSAAYRRHNQKIANKRSDGTEERGKAEDRDADDEDDDRLRTAKTDEIPLELLDEPKATAGAGSGGPRPQRRKKRR
ncbi:protein translocase subunit SecF [Glycomyces tenuis]|uniref:protein translocase subunit SecF n=1 Tax=Glycomyces tenuis TaxID=58116 RepID=UPI0003FA6F7D|nr:protein translocase subunit SecF [Glycomyces tenuis]